jgi:hypothetical protein
MANSIYDSANIYTIDGIEIYITPLKLKYLRMFMTTFDKSKTAKNQDEFLDVLIECCSVAMKQYYPIIQTPEDVADSFDVKTMYTILDIAASIKMDPDKKEEEPAEEPKTVSTVKSESKDGSTWDTMDLAKLESEVFLLGIWKDYEDLETSLSMPELSATLEAKRLSDYNDKKFMAAIQGVDIEANSGSKPEPDAWERMKTRVLTNGATDDPNDILALQGEAATKAGFGIGEGLSYEKWD